MKKQAEKCNVKFCKLALEDTYFTIASQMRGRKRKAGVLRDAFVTPNFNSHQAFSSGICGSEISEDVEESNQDQV